MELILTTLPHYLSVIPLMRFYNDRAYEYVNTIVAASTLSILYHYYDEALLIGIIDYTAAFLWLLYDLYFGYFYNAGAKKVICANLAILLLNWSIRKSNPHYVILHSIWHLLSAAKCYYVSSLAAAAIRATPPPHATSGNLFFKITDF